MSERPIYLNYRCIEKADVNQFALQQCFKEFAAGYEYLIDDVWQPGKPLKKPEGKRVVFADIEDFRIARDVYFAWQDLTAQSQEKPVYPEKIIKKLYQARIANKPLFLFIP